MIFSTNDFKYLPRDVYMSLRRALTEVSPIIVGSVCKNGTVYDTYNAQDTFDKVIYSEANKKRRGVKVLRVKAISELLHFLKRGKPNAKNQLKHNEEILEKTTDRTNEVLLRD